MARIGELGHQLARCADLPSLIRTLVAGLERLGWDTVAIVVGDLEVRHGHGAGPHVLALSAGEQALGHLTVGGPGDLDALRGLTPWIAMAIDDRRAPRSSGWEASVAAARRTLDLTARQGEVFERLVRGASNKDIASALGCAENTVELHVTQILKKARAGNRTELAARYFARALVASP